MPSCEERSTGQRPKTKDEVARRLKRYGTTVQYEERCYLDYLSLASSKLQVGLIRPPPWQPGVHLTGHPWFRRSSLIITKGTNQAVMQSRRSPGSRQPRRFERLQSPMHGHCMGHAHCMGGALYLVPRPCKQEAGLVIGSTTLVRRTGPESPRARGEVGRLRRNSRSLERT